MDTKEKIQEILLYCAPKIREVLLKDCLRLDKDIQEIRIRIDKPLMIINSDGDWMIDSNGHLSKDCKYAFLPTERDMLQTLELMSENSIYAHQDELKNGYLTIKGGHRIGITGKVVLEQNLISTMKEISGINIRFAKQIIGCANNIMSQIINKFSVFNTLIASPPNCGKTTLLRDAVRQISNGIESLKFQGLKVGLVDERSEIASCYKGIPQNDIGIRTDVLDACPKPQGVLMLIRSMSPQVVATDELGTKADIEAAEMALNMGIKLITTTHAGDINELKRKPCIGELVRAGVFERLIILDNSQGVGTIKDILDGETYSPLMRQKNAF